MNFISHFYFDQNLDDSLFVAGQSTPDLVSIFDRSVRLKPRKLSVLVENGGVSADQMSFYHGVLRHIEGDRIFHSCDFFHTETARITKLLRGAFPNQEVKRSFFVAHVVLELILDKILIQRDRLLIDKFYAHFDASDLKHLISLTEWISQTSLPSYDAFLGKFISNKFLYRYTDQEYVTYVLKRILRQVNILEYDYLKTSIFSDLLIQYEEELSERYQDGFNSIGDQLPPIPGL